MLLVLLLVLSGCLKYDLTLVVADDDTLDGTLIVAVAREFAAGQDVFGQTGDPNPAQGSVTKEAYEDADYVGSRYIISGVPISEIDSLSTDSSTRFALTHEGQEYVLDASIDFNLAGSDTVPTQSSFTAMVSFTFPGAVTESNGAIDGNTVMWSQLRPDSENTLTARASAIPNGLAASSSAAGIPWWIWVLGIAGALLIAAVVVILVLRKRRAAKSVRDAGAAAFLGQQPGRYDEYGNWIPPAGYGTQPGYYDSGQADGYDSYYGTYGQTPSAAQDYQADGLPPGQSGGMTGDTYRGPPRTAPASQPAPAQPTHPEPGHANPYPQPGFASPGYPRTGSPGRGYAGETVVGYPEPAEPVQGWVVRPPT